MKGILHKTEQGWVVEYAKHAELPLHPDFIEMMDTCFTSKFSQEIEFEIVTEWNTGEVGVNGLTYAKLIKEEKPFINNREDKLETLAKLLAKSWFYGKWDWETPNERVMQMLMQDLGLYPFKNEDEMIQQTRVDEDLYKEAVDKVELRNPRIMPVENQIGDTNEMVCMFEPTTDTSSATICKHCGKEKFLHNQVPDVGKMVEDDVVKLAEQEYNHIDNPIRSGIDKWSYKTGFIEGYNKAKETLYTEEQLKTAIHKAIIFSEENRKITLGDYAVKFPNFYEELIQSLKQPKQ